MKNRIPRLCRGKYVLLDASTIVNKRENTWMMLRSIPKKGESLEREHAMDISYRDNQWVIL